ncbi:glycine/betaine ABC transporter [Photobacterium proteolyticum]|uniref:Glycine/betaine ABC transporter n=1 Tax=Photobacterium proteolyticum TaxID=1903952 RepID=A0A1Q9GCN8_9GAMM|nr:BCCT family transporter [Photobacterium proteolyticum]OLQ72163.1 glycine/betaine ABC transporter [Photobacterium proteolyticum]
MNSERKIDKPLMAISLSVILFVVVGLTLFPEQGNAIASQLFNTLTNQFGEVFLFFGFFSVIFLAKIALGKYGEIKLGNDKPEYSQFTYLAMMVCAGLGSATVYWAFVEWGYYYMTPPFDVEPYSPMAAEWATSYNMFHWGISAWSLYCIASLPVAYSFHVKKNPQLKLSAVCESIMGRFYNPVIGKVIDTIFIFSCVGAMGITLGLSVPMVTEGIAYLLGVENSFAMNVGLMLFITALFSVSSYVGIEKGMAKLSDMNTKLAVIFVLLILIVGPTSFIINQMTNGYGLMLQNFIRMSLWTDPVEGGSFPTSWTVFYWAYWMTYVPFMALFVTKVSKGRKLKEVIGSMVIGGSAGCFIFFGVLGSFSMNVHLTEIVDVTRSITENGGSATVIAVLNTLPASALFIIIFAIMSTLFLATTLDSASFTLAATAANQLDENANPPTALRLFWCLILAAVPLAMMFIDAPLNTVQTLAIVTSLPLMIVIFIMLYGFSKWLKEDFGGETEIVANQSTSKVTTEAKKESASNTTASADDSETAAYLSPSTNEG